MSVTVLMESWIVQRAANSSARNKAVGSWVLASLVIGICSIFLNTLVQGCVFVLSGHIRLDRFGTGPVEEHAFAFLGAVALHSRSLIHFLASSGILVIQQYIFFE